MLGTTRAYRSRYAYLVHGKLAGAGWKPGLTSITGMTRPSHASNVTSC